MKKTVLDIRFWIIKSKFGQGNNKIVGQGIRALMQNVGIGVKEVAYDRGGRAGHFARVICVKERAGICESDFMEEAQGITSQIRQWFADKIVRDLGITVNVSVQGRC